VKLSANQIPFEEEEAEMGKINLKRVYHIGIPVNDLEQAERFYVDVLGMRVHGPMAFKENGKRNYRVSDEKQDARAHQRVLNLRDKAR